MHSFRKRAPHHIALRDLSAAELAQVSLGLVHRAGYELHSADTRMFSGEEGELELMTLIVNQSYTPEQIKDANYYLALELKDRAISNKNRRVRGGGQGDAGDAWDALRLKATDFGVNLLGREEMQRLREEVDLEVQGTVGYSSAKAFMQDVREKVLSVEAGGDRR